MMSIEGLLDRMITLVSISLCIHRRTLEKRIGIKIDKLPYAAIASPTASHGLASSLPTPGSPCRQNSSDCQRVRCMEWKLVDVFYLSIYLSLQRPSNTMLG